MDLYIRIARDMVALIMFLYMESLFIGLLNMASTVGVFIGILGMIGMLLLGIFYTLKMIPGYKKKTKEEKQR